MSIYFVQLRIAPQNPKTPNLRDRNLVKIYYLLISLIFLTII